MRAEERIKLRQSINAVSCSNNYIKTPSIWHSTAILTVTVTGLIFHLFVCELDRITMQVLMLMLQEASGSNQCYIKSRRERGSSVKQEEDALR